MKLPGRVTPRYLPTILSCLSVCLSLIAGVQAQGTVEISEVRVNYLFGNQVTFSARLRTVAPVQEAWLLFQSVGENRAHLARLTLLADGHAVYQHAIASEALRPFAAVYFWYRIILSSGDVYTSPPYTFQYIDNRFPWQVLEDEWVRVHWYAGDLDFGQTAFDVAHVGLQRISEVLPYQKSPPLDLYLYASTVDLQNALDLGGPVWANAQATPDLGVALLAIAPDAEAPLTMERQIPHELAHLVLYQRAGTAYERLPLWLREGVASLAELYPNPEYRQALSAAAQSGSLLDINTLCESFPGDAARAYLAYAEADSFTRYLYSTYGPPALYNLILAYADGLNCEQGARRALGLTLTQLDRRWRESVLNTSPVRAAGQNLLPYLILLVMMLSIPAWGWSQITARRSHE